MHHNLSWNNNGAGITLNSDAENHLVANNTIVDNQKPFATFTYSGHTPTQKGTRIINNLISDTRAHSGNFQQGLISGGLITPPWQPKPQPVPALTPPAET